MKTSSKIMVIATIGLIVIVAAGCSSLMTVRERAISIDDVIKISKVNVDSDVIIRQIEVTHSRFKLEPEDIIRLKEEGVDDEVIEYMIETGFTTEWVDYQYLYTPYDYWYFDYYSYYPLYEYYYYYSPFWDGLRGVPYYRFRSPYSYPVNIQTDYYRRFSRYYERDYDRRDHFPHRRPDVRRPGEHEKSSEELIR